MLLKECDGKVDVVERGRKVESKCGGYSDTYKRARREIVYFSQHAGPRQTLTRLRALSSLPSSHAKRQNFLQSLHKG